MGIGKRYLEQRRAGPWRYTESGVGPAAVAVQASYEDGQFIRLTSPEDQAKGGLVLDVSMWKFEVRACFVA